jgi:hypothetical protein
VADILRLAFLLVTIVTLALAAALLQPEWAHDLGLAGWDLRREASEGDGQAPQMLEPDEHDLAIQQRIHEKERVVDDVLQGRLTLAEGLAQFRRLNAVHPLAGGPGCGSRDQDLQQLLSWIHAALTRAGQPEEDCARFEDELLRRLDQYPPPAPAGDAVEQN